MTAEVATLRLEPDGTMDATTGCRSFSGVWIETGDEIRLTTFGQDDDSPNVAADGTTTCDEQVIAQEGHVLSVLGDGFRTQWDGQRLTVISRDALGLIHQAAPDRPRVAGTSEHRLDAGGPHQPIPGGRE